MSARLVLAGAQPLFRKEVLRFWKVSFQTVAAPVLTAVMYLLVFGHALNGRVSVYDGVSYVQFLIPGLVMMSVLQNAFANSSSSLIQSKITGNLVFLLVTPLSPSAWVPGLRRRGHRARHGGGRGRDAGDGVVRAAGARQRAVDPRVRPAGLRDDGHAGADRRAVGREEFDQLAAFQNFIIMPLTFLSGVFYSVHSLPPLWHVASRLNPFFYMIDGFRHGFFGVSDVSPWISLGVVGGSFVIVAAVALGLLRSGYKLRH